MGFTPKRKTLVLDFEGTELDGLTVRARSVALGQFLHLATLAGKLEDGQNLDELRGLFESVATAIVEWDLQDEDGNDVPPTADAIMGLEFGQAQLLVSAWVQAVGAVSAPLERPSTGGVPSVEESLRMVPLSAPRAS